MRFSQFGFGAAHVRLIATLAGGAALLVSSACSDQGASGSPTTETNYEALKLTPGQAPVAVGHGAILYADGTVKKPSPEVIRDAQSYLVNRLASEATPDVKAWLHQSLPEAANSPAIKGLQPQGQVSLEQLESDAKVLEWLVNAVEAPDATVLQQMSGFLRDRIGRAKNERAPTDDDLGSQSAALESNAGGAAYATACAAAGVPNPPAWRSASWVFRGTLTGSNNFLGGSDLAEVYSYTSTSPAGVCIALPRRPSTSSTSYELVGIICQGTVKSRSCFWDSRKGQTITTSETSLAVPGPKFVGGAELGPNNQGVCTDCHAGENSFIIHPTSALGSVPNTIAANWVRPLILPSWPQNTGPGSELISAGTACSSSGCHTKSAGRRFPRLEDLSGWCSIANTATGNTMPVSAPHETVLGSKCTPRAKATKFATAKTKWHDFLVDDTELPFVGDFNGDGRTDLLTFLLNPTADAYVALTNSTGSGLASLSKWHDFFGLTGEQLNVGDFNGDGKDDIITATMNSSGTVYVATSTGAAFNPSSVWNGHILAGEVYQTGDFNGDRRDDIAIFTKGSTNDVLVQLSNGSSFGGAGLWHGNLSPGSEVPLVGDFNADGYDDIVSFTLGSTNDAMVSLSSGSSFGTASKWHDTFGWPGEVMRVADMNGDGKDDIVTFVLWSQAVYVALSTGTSFAPSTLWHGSFASTGQAPFVGDFNADHRADGILFTKGAAADVFVSASIP
ncbi:MAG TPA: VCBS repeat-containing protein [Polyangiaceae bacterium]|nr:VCBS repeat-containing protein [Polyangiaceae bacterium]